MGKSYRVRISNVIPCCLMRVPDDAAASTKLLYWGTLGKRDEVCGILITGAQSAVCVSPSLLPLLSHIPHSLHSPPPLEQDTRTCMPRWLRLPFSIILPTMIILFTRYPLPTILNAAEPSGSLCYLCIQDGLLLTLLDMHSTKTRMRVNIYTCI